MNARDIPKTDKLSDCLSNANRIAQCEFRVEYLGTEHVLIAMARDRNSIVGFVLDEMKITEESIQELVIKPEQECITIGYLPMVPRLKNALGKGLEFSRKWGRETVGTSELILSMLDDPECVASVLLSQKCDLETLKTKIEDVRLQFFFRTEAHVLGFNESIEIAIRNRSVQSLSESLKRSRERLDEAIRKLESL